MVQEPNNQVPPATTESSARDAFRNLLTSTALLASVISASVLYCGYLDHLFPDPAWRTYAEQAAAKARPPLAAILVAFPCFLLLTILLSRELAANPLKHFQPVRQWLIYLTLFFTATTVASDFITLLYYFLEGHLTERLVLKGLALLAIAGTVFCYYTQTLRPATKDRGTLRVDRLLALAGIVLAGGAVFEGFALAGSPFIARQVRLDQERLDDLERINEVILSMVTKERGNQRTLIEPLPTSLDDVARYQRTHAAYYQPPLHLNDPETGAPYQYRVTGKSTFELCATFALPPRESQVKVFWNHPAGEHCFALEAEFHPEKQAAEAETPAAAAE